MEYREVKMGKLLPSFNGGNYQDITLCVTEECNLRCKYCYMYNKNSVHVMSIDTAKKAVDFILSQEVKFPAAVWNFIGGEPTLEMDLVDEITDYIKYKMYELDHPWFDQCAFLVETNGVSYGSEKVQKYAQKNEGLVQFAITIDGNKEKHDLARVTKDGHGSYDIVEKNIKLWISQAPGEKMTKATFSSEDLPYLKDSIINLWNLGIKTVAANVVFENVWRPGDAEIYEKQLKSLADYVIENKLWDEYSVRFFDPKVGYQLGEEDRKKNFCGTGIMITVATDGRLYPCIRFLDFCMTDNLPGYCVGDINDGFDQEKLQAFDELCIDNISEPACIECPIASGCFSCAGNSYDDAKGKTLHRRTTYHCDMHKAQVRANKYFWKRYSKVTGYLSPREVSRFAQFYWNNWKLNGLKYVYIYDGIDSLAVYKGPFTDEKLGVTNCSVLEDIIKYVEDNDMVPVLITSCPQNKLEELDYIVHIKVFPAECDYQDESAVEMVVPVYTVGVSDINRAFNGEYCIFNVPIYSLHSLEEAISKMLYKKKIILNPINIEEWGVKEIDAYEKIVSAFGSEVITESNELHIMNVENVCYISAVAK